MEYVLNVQNGKVFASGLLRGEEITESAATKMAEHMDRRVVDANDCTHYEQKAMESECVSASPIEDVIGPNTKREGDYVVSTL